MHAQLADCRIAVVGLGLIGASLCMDLKRLHLCREVRGISRSSQAVARGIRTGVIDQGTNRLESGVAGADIVVLATPVRVAIRQMQAMGPCLKPGAVVVDVGSTSVQVSEAMAALPPQAQPIVTHPMAGKETSGFDSAEPGLFQNAVWVLSPLPRTSPDALALFTQLVHAVGAHPVTMDARKHDRVVAAISHLPFLVSSALVCTVAAMGQDEPEVWELAAGGFRDTSRVAASEVSMFLDILMTNRDNIGRPLDLFIQHIMQLRAWLEAEDEEALVQCLSANRRARQAWFAKYEARNRAFLRHRMRARGARGRRGSPHAKPASDRPYE